ncbi:hypothetical protein MMC11_004218 [Xylographa trunciseda]|nr:hypothetical protein [Xylographa trunciseda]
MSSASSVSSSATTHLGEASQHTPDKFGHTRHYHGHEPISRDEPNKLSSKERWDSEHLNKSDAVHPLFEIKDWRKNLPPYLFRASYNRSSSANRRNSIIPRPKQANSRHESILGIPFVEAKEMLEKHLLQKSTRMSQFGSWSSSLLFVLQDAMRKADYQPEATVCIYVLNTRKLINVSIFPATMLLRAYGIKSEGTLQQDHCNSEYLAHGTLDDETCLSAVALHHLIEGGLYDLFPELSEEQGKKALSQRVEDLRLKFFAHTWPITACGVGALRDLALCFGTEWVLPMTVAFLSLRLRRQKGRQYLHDMLQALSGLKFPEGCLANDYLFGDFHCSTQDVPEVEQFTRLLHRVCEAKYRELLLRHEADAYEEIGRLFEDPSGFRALGLYSRDSDAGPSFDNGFVDEESSSEEEESGCGEEVEWGVDEDARDCD